jgi:hypothetical protein
MMNRRGVRCGVLLVLSAVLLGGCQTAYYGVWEKLGKEKRHLLKDQVEKARDEQAEASETYKEVIDRIKEVYGFDGGELEAFYDRLKEDYEDCRNRADAIESRIDKVQQIAEDLFSEWEREIGQMGNANFQSASRKSLKETQARYRRLEKAMIQAQNRMTPVVAQLNDYVIFLKHNLNARAIGAIKAEMGDIENEVDALIRDISRSVSEADAFLSTLE